MARSLAEHGGHTPLVSKEEAMDVLALSYEHNLVQIGENVQESPAFICNCCGCCCEALQASRRFAPMVPGGDDELSPHINEEKCIGCGKCAKVCPILAIELKQKQEGKRGGRDQHGYLSGVRRMREKLSGESDRTEETRGTDHYPGEQHRPVLSPRRSREGDAQNLILTTRHLQAIVPWQVCLALF